MFNVEDKYTHTGHHLNHSIVSQVKKMHGNIRLLGGNDWEGNYIKYIHSAPFDYVHRKYIIRNNAGSFTLLVGGNVPGYILFVP